ncbi:hypothetical protein GCM10009863_21960 [Streptomyces axinellae]|uniref:Uncharacterized protein n=1 Tax=Streptomyces axinellae TaxID=552788 RepID=A0ABP6C8U0_9ACTN
MTSAERLWDASCDLAGVGTGLGLGLDARVAGPRAGSGSGSEQVLPGLSRKSASPWPKSAGGLSFDSEVSRVEWADLGRLSWMSRGKLAFTQEMPDSGGE